MRAASGPDSRFYVTGGTMDPDSASYIVRRADTELLNALRNGELCHVLASRQMGKSSLMASTARRLAADGVQCAIVDTNMFSEKKGAADDWYYALVDHIADKLGLSLDTGAWWQENWRLPPLGKLTRFLDRVVLAGCPGQVVVFVDEIDSTIPLTFSDDFFAAIRACYNARVTEPRFKRLNFVLLGVATPAQLIRDPTRTPFNVGCGVELNDFTASEAAPLAAGLHDDSERAADLLRRVLKWTDGHPYLTQTLCWYLSRNSTWEVDELVKDIFLSKRAAREEPNLRLVRERLTQGEADLASVLHVYKDIVEGQPVRDDPNSPVHASLRLSGVVKPDPAGELKVRNRIYRKVFSAEWLASEIPVERPAGPAMPPELADAYVTYDALRSLPEFQPKATGVLARFFESRGLRDEALLVRIHALQENQSVVNRRLVQNLIDFDYRDLLISFAQEAPITASALNSSATAVLTGSQDGTARLWSASSGEPLLPPFRHRGPVTALAFSPDGKWLATGSDDYTAYVWNAETGERGVPLQHQARIRSVAFSSDGEKLITTSADGTAGIWHTLSGEPVCMLLRHLDSIRMGVFSPDSSVVVTTSQDRTAVIWPLSLGGQFGTALLHEDNVTLVAFHPSGAAFVTAGDDGKARVWDVQSGLLLRTFGHEEPVLDLAISPDGAFILTGSADHSARLWRWGSSSETPCATLRHNDSVLAVAFAPDGRSILTGSADRNLRLWNVPDGRPLGLPYRHCGKVTSVSCGPGGLKALTSDQDGAARLWRLDTQARPTMHRITHSAEINDAVFSRDGTRIATSSSDNAARTWTVNGEPAAPALIHPAQVSAMAFNPDGAVLATGCEDGAVRLWDAGSGEFLEARINHRAAVRVLSFSPDGAHLASGSDDRTAVVWGIASNSTGPVLQHRGSVRVLAFSPDGTRVMTGGSDRAAYLWSRDSDKQIGSTLEHSSTVSAIAFRPNSSGLFLSSSAKTVHLWRMKDDQDEARPVIAFSIQYSDRVQYAAFTPRGDRFLVITQSWAYYYDLSESGPVPISSRLLAGSWIGAFRWREEPDALDLGLLDTGDSLRIVSISLDLCDLPTISGEPEDLLFEWQRRLGRQITRDARLTTVS